MIRPARALAASSRVPLSSLSRMQFGLLLQIIQNEQVSADCLISPIGHVLAHFPQSLHFSSSTHTGECPSRSRIQVVMSSRISIALVGQL